MKRCYHLSKKITEEQAKEIVQELKELEDIHSVKMNEDRTCLTVGTKDDQFAQVMGTAVNICSRNGGAELSFQKFVVD